MAIGLVGGLMLLYMGLQMFSAMRKGYGGPRDLPYPSVVAGIVTTGASPYFFLWWATVGAALVISTSSFGALGVFLFAFSHWLIDFLWVLFISVVVFKSRGLWSRKVQNIVFGACAVSLVGFGAWFVFSAAYTRG
ncbi:LysE family transporter [Chloroflexota bacterium]